MAELPVDDDKEVSTSPRAQITITHAQTVHTDNDTVPKPDFIGANSLSVTGGNVGVPKTMSFDRGERKAKRAAHRSKKEEKKWKKKLKTIGRQHPEFELTYDLLLGIRTSVSITNCSVMRSSVNDQEDDSSSEDEEAELEKEFRDARKYHFPSAGSHSTPGHCMNDFQFKDYSRPAFAQLREWFGIKPETYLVQLCGGFSLLEFISNSKSGQFFFYSHEGRFLIKSMTRSESLFLRKILPDYYHYVQRQPHTLITKFYGMYRVKPHQRDAIYFVVMGSVFFTPLEIHKIYDLKGSTHGRAATPSDKEKDVPVLKDLDFLENNQYLTIGRDKAKLFKDQLRKDVELLRKLKIMDYSVLLGIHYRDRNTETPQSPREDELNPTLEPALSHTDITSMNGITPKPDRGTIPSPQKKFQLTNASPHQPFPRATTQPNKGSFAPSSTGAAPSTTASMPAGSGKRSSQELMSSSTQPATSIPATVATTNDTSMIHREQFGIGVSRKPTDIKAVSAPSGLEMSDTPNTPSSESDSLSSDDLSSDTDSEEEKKDSDYDTPRFGPSITELKKGAIHPTADIMRAHKQSQSLAPPMTRLTSRRLSQIGAKQNFTVKTPLEKSFDVPDLIDLKMTIKEEIIDETENESGSIFSTYQNGMVHFDEDDTMGNEVYFAGIIDILQKYNKRKKVENFFRGLQTDEATISAVPPEKYAKRMVDFLKDKIM